MSINPNILLQIDNSRGAAAFDQSRQAVENMLTQPARNQLLNINIQKAQQGVTAQAEQDDIRRAATFAIQNAHFIQRGDIDGFRAAVQASVFDDDDKRLLMSAPPEQVADMLGAAVSTAQNLGIFGAGMSRTAGERERAALIADLESGQNPYDESGRLRPEAELSARQLSAARALGMIARPMGSAEQTIAAQGTAPQVAEVRRTLELGSETGKQQARVEFLPDIEAKVARAAAMAKGQSESQIKLNSIRAAAPAITKGIEALRELAPLATHTMSGRVFDMAMQELGLTGTFGTPEGATARAKFESIVLNQVIPSLKQMGASPTDRDFQAMMSTMGDINKTPAEKLASLDAYKAQLDRNLETAEREAMGFTGQGATPSPGVTEAPVADTKERRIQELMRR